MPLADDGTGGFGVLPKGRSEIPNSGQGGAAEKTVILFVRAAVLGILVTVVGWSFIHPTYWRLDGLDFVAANSDYLFPVKGILSGDGPSLVVPPLFPLMLAAVVKICDGGAVSAGAAYALVVMLCVGLTTGMIAVLLPAPRGANTGVLLGAALWAANPLAFWFSTHVSSETLFLPLSVATIAAMLRADRARAAPRYFWAATSGVAAGLAMLTRPIGVGIPMVLAGVLLWNGWSSKRKTALAQGAVIIITALLVTIPWEVRMYEITGRVLPLSQNGPNSTLDGLTYASDPNRGRVPIATSAAARRPQDWWYANRGEFLEGRRSIVSGVVERVREDPGGMAALLAEKLGWSWYGTYQGDRMRSLLLVQLLIIGGLLVASRRAWSAKQSCASESGRLLVVTGWAVVGYTWCMTIAVLSIARYMVPATAPLFGLVGVVLARPETFRR